MGDANENVYPVYRIAPLLKGVAAPSTTMLGRLTSTSSFVPAFGSFVT